MNFRYRLHGVQYAFTATAPYTAGHVLTAQEALALNVLRSENVREGVRTEFDELIQGVEKGQVLSEDQLSAIQSAIDEYDLNYQFGGAPVQPRDRLGAIEKEAKLLAQVRAPEGASDEEIELLAQSIDLVAEARQRVETRVRIMATEMEDLLK